MYVQEIVKVVFEQYGLTGTVSPLAGDADYNFRLWQKDGFSYLVKICKPNVSQEVLDFQVALLVHMNKAVLPFQLPSIVRTNEGEAYFEWRYGTEIYLLRVHTWVEGRLLSEVHPRTRDLLRQWGSVCGHLSKHLASFEQGPLRFILLQMINGLWVPIFGIYMNR